MISLLEHMHTSIVEPDGRVTSCEQKEGKAEESSYHHILPLLFLSACGGVCACVCLCVLACVCACVRVKSIFGSFLTGD